MRSSLFWHITWRGLVAADVSGQSIISIFKGQAVFLDCLTLEDGKVGCPETSVTTNLRGITCQKAEDLIRRDSSVICVKCVAYSALATVGANILAHFIT